MAGITRDHGIDHSRARLTLSGFWHLAAKFPALIQHCFVAERARWALCIPVFLGMGIASYFLLPVEPAVWWGALCAVISLAGGFVLRRRVLGLILCVMAFLVAVGFGGAQFRTALIQAPVLDRKIGPVWVVGHVTRVEVRSRGVRIWLDRPSIDRLDAQNTPRKVRVKLARANGDFRPGDRVRLRAILHPPSGPAAPGAFDFARRAYFLQLGAVGYAVRPPVIVKRAAVTGFAVHLASLRQTITARIHAALPGRTGTVAAALMTGERGAIPEEVLVSMRESGLAHLLAISGLHIGLVAGLLFFCVRLCLALWERGALRYPIKKWAALAALLGSLGYLLISGSTLPTQRAFLMLCFVMLAVLIDRSAISMNLVAWAAAVILLMAPESLMSVSFQMSFAAVTALVATYEFNLIRRTTGAHATRIRRIGAYFGAVLLTTLVAGLATAPFALYHFNQIALYGMLANFLAVPLTALWIMPFAILGFLLMPLGLEQMALIPMGWGIDGVIAIAQFVQALPGSVAAFPPMPSWALGLVAMGGLWLCLWLTAWRWFGMIGIMAGFAAIAWVETPDILISDTGKMVAVKQRDGLLAFSSQPRGFVAETWLRRAGIRVSPGKKGRALAPRLSGTQCDGLGCIIHSKGHVIALARHMAALPDDCVTASLVVSRMPVKKWRCTRPLEIVDRFSVWRNGAHAVYLSDGGTIRTETVGSRGGKRPWSRYPRTRKKHQ